MCRPRQGRPSSSSASHIALSRRVFVGYEIQRKLVTALNIKDILVALPEDLVTIGLACFFVSG
jgi:hypothetical protein